MGTVVHAGSGARGGGRAPASDRVRPDRRGPGRAPARDRLPGRAAPVLDAAACRSPVALTALIFVDQRAAAPAAHRRAAVLAGHRRRHHPAAAARGRHAPASPPGRGSWPGARCWSSGWSASRTSATSTCSFTDKTGTLTEGRISFMRRARPDGAPDDRVAAARAAAPPRRRVAGDGAGRRQPARRRAVGGARGRGPAAGSPGTPRLGAAAVRPRAPHGRVLVDDAGRAAMLITKGAPEAVLAPLRATCPDAAAGSAASAQFAAGSRVVAVAAAPAAGADDARRPRTSGT